LNEGFRLIRVLFQESNQGRIDLIGGLLLKQDRSASLSQSGSDLTALLSPRNPLPSSMNSEADGSENPRPRTVRIVASTSRSNSRSPCSSRNISIPLAWGWHRFSALFRRFCCVSARHDRVSFQRRRNRIGFAAIHETRVVCGTSSC
jgi:hypothetical protein